MLHGGAGAMRTLEGRDERAYRDSLRLACRLGSELLVEGSSALEAAVQAVVTMEDSGNFNAGLGSCLNFDGEIEMDAAVMRGSDRAFGGVAAIRQVANPVVAACQVMEQTRHCLLGAEGATRFAKAQGLTLRSDFPSQSRRLAWRRKREAVTAGGALEAGGLAAMGGVLGIQGSAGQDADSSDTVGAVAMDADGSLACAVSTGGLWLKQAGRIGDSPLPGAGLWAVDGEGVAVATGTGEMILRSLLCKEVVDRMHHGASRACALGMTHLEALFGPGVAGVIAIDPSGMPGFALNTRGMGRAVWRLGMERPAVAIWPEEGWDETIAEVSGAPG